MTVHNSLISLQISTKNHTVSVFDAKGATSSPSQKLEDLSSWGGGPHQAPKEWLSSLRKFVSLWDFHTFPFGDPGSQCTFGKSWWAHELQLLVPTVKNTYKSIGTKKNYLFSVSWRHSSSRILQPEQRSGRKAMRATLQVGLWPRWATQCLLHRCCLSGRKREKETFQWCWPPSGACRPWFGHTTGQAMFCSHSTTIWSATARGPGPTSSLRCASILGSIFHGCTYCCP